MYCEVCGVDISILAQRSDRMYCSRSCTNKAYWKRHAERLKEKSREWVKRNPEKRIQAILKYQHSEKGKKQKQDYYLKHREKIVGRAIKRIYADKEYYFKRINSGVAARRKLANHREKKCERCLSVEFIHVHHIDHNPFNNKLDNLMWLCRACHGKEHRKHQV